MFVLTSSTKKLAKMTKRIRGVCGGTSAGKTISILQILISKAQKDKRATLTSVVSESFPHLKRGAMRDFKNIMQEHGYWKESAWNATDSIYTFETGSKIEFFSADQPSKVRGPRRDRLFINECNNVAYESFDQLAVRTRLEIWLDWNPTNEFWFYDLLNTRDDVEMITVTYKDNEGLPETIVKDIEAHKLNKNWWTVYGLGQLGEVEGRIYKGWKIIDEIPHEARLEGYGLDFGYSNDPTAVVAVYYYNGGYILDEILYRKGMSNQQIASFMNNLDFGVIVADSAEPKSIDELQMYGLSVVAAKKGSGSILQGIGYVQEQSISMTKRSVNLIKEYRNYLWQTDKNGKTINVPEGGFDHALDAVRYKLSSVLKPKYEIRPTVQTSGELSSLWS
jgi:phage terminase large subunit|nr:MAG TPA: terminase large subunit [Caudoviricetes sp.]